MWRPSDLDQASPNNWITLVNDRCDLDLAFEHLEGWNHFHTDTLRGRIRTLQLRPEEAWPFFERARRRAPRSAGTLRNGLRRLYLEVYRFENALLEESAPDGGDPRRTRRCLQGVLRTSCACSDVASRLQQLVQGTFLLNRGDFRQARKIFAQLLRRMRDFYEDTVVNVYLGAAVAHRGLRRNKEANRHLENACLAIPAMDNTFNMGHYAGVAAALLRIWGREEDAMEWDRFNGHLKIPQKTVELFRERSRRIVDRSQAGGPLFLI